MPAEAAVIVKGDEATEPEQGGRCRGCGAEAAGLYCAQCGQPQRVRRLTARRVLREAWSHLVHLDTGFLYTIRMLTRRPGRAVRAYVEERRSVFVNPFKYAFILTSVLVVTVTLLKIPIWEGTPWSEGVEREMYMRIFGLQTYGLFLWLVPTAALQRWLFRRHGDNGAECYAFGLFVFGHLSLFYTLLALLGLTDLPHLGMVADVAMPVGSVLYLTGALRGFYPIRLLPALGAGVLLFATFHLVGLLGGAALVPLLYALYY